MNFQASDPSRRLRAALAAGTRADPALAGQLVERCAVEPDFFVRDMLTWALTRLPGDVVLPLLHAQLADPRPQARSQGLHTLSKIRSPETWGRLDPQLLHDAVDQVARAAWRAAVALVPGEERAGLAVELTAELGKGDLTRQRSLSRALAELVEVAEPLLGQVRNDPDPRRRAHARATMQLIEDPTADVTADLDQARKVALWGDDQQN